MKVGIDCRLWNETGVGRYTKNLVLNLLAIDKSNDYVFFAQSKDIDQIKFQISSIRQAQDRNFKFQIIKADIRWHTLAEQLELPKILNKENLDLVHFPYFSVPIFYKKPFVITIHDLILNHYPTGQASTLPLPFYYIKNIGYRFVISQAARKAKQIIAVSQATKKEIIDHLNTSDNKISVIYEGFDSQISTNKKQNPFNKKYFLYVGNAYPHKNLNVLISAFQKFQEKHHDVLLVLVGKEDYFYKQLKEKIYSLHLDANVLIYGYATDEDLSVLYEHAISLIIPSKMEGFGLPGLEAMAHRCSVICSDIPVFKEIYNNVPIYFDKNNSDDLLEKMEAVYVKLPHEQVKRGLDRVKDFSWKKMAEETLNVYNSSL